MGDPSDPLVFAIHGWLDNALSFIKLAPLLKGYRECSRLICRAMA